MTETRQTIEGLIAESEHYDQAKKDALRRPSTLQFVDGRLYTDGFDVPLLPTDWCLGQIAQKLNVPPAYLRRCPPGLKDANLNHWLRVQADGPDKLLRLRTRGESLRGYLSNRYVPIDNTDILTIVKEMLGDRGYNLLRPRLTPDGMQVRIRVLDDIGPDGNYGIGAYVHNGEVGNRGLMVAPFVQRNSCTNSIVNAGEAWKIRHIGRSQLFLQGRGFNHSKGYIRAGIKEHLGISFNVAADMLDNVVEAEVDKVPDLGNTIDTLAKRYKMTEQEKSAVLIGTERQPTRMGVINGITFMAQTLEDPDRTLGFEALAGALLAEPGTLFSEAARMAEKAMVEV
jgi:hypothetical protein